MNEQGGVSLDTVRAVYSGAEGDLWELLMGQQIHIGGMQSSLELAKQAGIGAGQRGVDLCCCNGAGMRLLVRMQGVASMIGVDATAAVIERGQGRTRAEGLADRIEFVHADVCASGLPDHGADFVWGEDAWCYVLDKPRLIAEAVRILRPGGVIAFTDWVAGAVPMSSTERARLLAFMSFPNLESVAGYAALLDAAGCQRICAEDTGRFARYTALYMDMVNMQLGYDALRILGFDQEALTAIGVEMAFLRDLADAGKLAQGQFIARRP